MMRRLSAVLLLAFALGPAVEGGDALQGRGQAEMQDRIGEGQVLAVLLDHGHHVPVGDS